MESSKVHCTMIHFSKAFHEVNRDIVKDRLLKLCLPKMIDILSFLSIRYILENTFPKVRYNNKKGEDLKMNNGFRKDEFITI